MQVYSYSYNKNRSLFSGASINILGSFTDSSLQTMIFPNDSGRSLPTSILGIPNVGRSSFTFRNRFAPNCPRVNRLRKRFERSLFFLLCICKTAKKLSTPKLRLKFRHSNKGQRRTVGLWAHKVRPFFSKLLGVWEALRVLGGCSGTRLSQSQDRPGATLGTKISDKQAGAADDRWTVSRPLSFPSPFRMHGIGERNFFTIKPEGSFSFSLVLCPPSS